MTAPDYSAAADRNKQAILDVLISVVPAQGNALEIASGTGQHVAWFAYSLPRWTWQPSDAQSDGFASINAWVTEKDVSNVRAPVVIDVMTLNWLPGQQLFDLIYCANMLHIAPWATCAALMYGSAQHLAPSGRLVTYGPYVTG
jgi:tRNA G46 methylase TrmB